MPMRRRSAYNSARFKLRMSSPATTIEPLSARTWPVMSRSKVVLPVPLGPMTAVTLPRGMSTSRPSKIGRPLTAYLKFRISTIEESWFNGMPEGLRPLRCGATSGPFNSSRGLFHRSLVRAAGGEAVHLGTYRQRLLAGRKGRQLPAPGAESVFLQSAPITEGQRPWQRALRVHEAQVQGRLRGTLPPRQEGDAGHRGRHLTLQSPQGGLCHLFRGRLLHALLARNDHVRLQDHALQIDAGGKQMREDPVE